MSLSEFDFVTKENRPIKVILDQKPRIDFGRLKFSFKVESEKEEDVTNVLSVISQVIKVLLVKPPTLIGKNTLEWSGQASMEGFQLLNVAQSYLKDNYGIVLMERTSEGPRLPSLHLKLLPSIRGRRKKSESTQRTLLDYSSSGE